MIPALVKGRAGKAKPDSSLANAGEDDRAAQTKGANLRPTSAKDERIKLDQSVVNVIISVTDPLGRFVTGLGTDHFEVFDDKVKQEIKFFSDEDAPISIGIVYDVSGSMKERIARSVRALRRFIETSHNDDDFFLIGFNDRAKLIQDFTTSGDQIAGHLMLVQPKGSTALYDASYLAIEKVQQGRHTKKSTAYNLGRPGQPQPVHLQGASQPSEGSRRGSLRHRHHRPRRFAERLWPFNSRRNHPDDRRPFLLSQCVQRAGTGRDLHQNSAGIAQAVLDRFLPNRSDKRSQVA